jgi:hypothetical protein
MCVSLYPTRIPSTPSVVSLESSAPGCPPAGAAPCIRVGRPHYGQVPLRQWPTRRRLPDRARPGSARAGPSGPLLARMEYVTAEHTADRGIRVRPTVTYSIPWNTAQLALRAAARPYGARDCALYILSLSHGMECGARYGARDRGACSTRSTAALDSARPPVRFCREIGGSFRGRCFVTSIAEPLFEERASNMDTIRRASRRVCEHWWRLLAATGSTVSGWDTIRRASRRVCEHWWRLLAATGSTVTDARRGRSRFILSAHRPGSVAAVPGRSSGSA